MSDDQRRHACELGLAVGWVANGRLQARVCPPFRADVHAAPLVACIDGDGAPVYLMSVAYLTHARLVGCAVQQVGFGGWWLARLDGGGQGAALCGAEDTARTHQSTTAASGTGRDGDEASHNGFWQGACDATPTRAATGAGR